MTLKRLGVAFVLCAVFALHGNADQLTAFLNRHCLRCHGPETQEADIRFDSLSTNPNQSGKTRWHDIWRQVADSQMPPEDELQPSDQDREHFLELLAERHGVPPSGDVLDHWSLQPISKTLIGQRESSDATPIDHFVQRKLHDAGLTLSPPADRRTLIRRVSLDLIGLPPSPGEVESFLSDPAPTGDAFARVVDRLLASPRYGERWAQHWLDVIRWAETVGFETNLERNNAWHYRDWLIRALNDDMPYDRFVFEQLAGDTTGADAALGFLVAGPANLPGQIGRDEEAMRQARQDELDEVVRTVSQAFFGLTIGCARCHDHKFDPISQRDYYSMQAVFSGLSYGHRRLRGNTDDQWTAKLPQIQSELDALTRQLERFRRQHRLRPALSAVTTESFEPILADAVRMEIAASTTGVASLYELEIHAAAAEDRPTDNVALSTVGSKASASSFALENQTRHYDNLIDGSTDPRQAFPWVAAQAGPAWLQIDLARPSNISKVTWHSGRSTPVSYRLSARNAETGEWRDVAHTDDRLPMTTDKRAASDIRLQGVSSEDVARLVTLLANIRSKQAQVAKLAAGPQTYAARFSDKPRPTWLLRRGDPMQQQIEVLPAAPAVLRNDDDNCSSLAEPDRRIRLARHLTRPDHPLTARVIANRIWQHHFGTGLVATSSDLGSMGAKPSHPKLLDWLARELITNGWSMKSLHREILLTKTYQQSAHPRSEALAVDADSVLLWRYPPRRLDAETIRDSILFVSGKLNLAMFGRGFDLFDQRGGLSDYSPKEAFDKSGWRRMVYAHKIRMETADVFGAFDCPDAGQMTPRRNTSITPIQALGLLNSPFMRRQSKFFAERLRRDPNTDYADAIVQGFELALARPPNEIESRTLFELASNHGMEPVCRALFNSSEFIFQH